MENNELKYIPMYKSYIDAVAKLSDTDRLAIYEAIFEYGFTGIEPTFDNPYLEMGWNLVKPNLVNNINNIGKKTENGKKGGRPKKDSTATKTSEVISEVAKEEIVSQIAPTKAVEDVSPIVDNEVEEESYLDENFSVKDVIDEDILTLINGSKSPTSDFDKVRDSILKSDNTISNNIKDNDEIKKMLSVLLKENKIDINHKFRITDFIIGKRDINDIDDLIQIYTDKKLA